MKRILALILIFVLSMSMTGCFRVIEDGEVGVQKTLGNYQDREKGTGVEWFLPIVSYVHVVNVKKITIDETLEVPTSDGLMVDVDVSVIYKINGDRASEIKQTITGNIENTLIRPYIRSTIRTVVSGYEVKDVYDQNSRKLVEQEVISVLTAKLGEDVDVVDVLLRKVTPPAIITKALNAQLEAEIAIGRKENEKQTAVLDADIAVAKAQGVADSNDIIAGSITENYLKYMYIESLATAGADVIYVPTEASIPIMEASRFNKE